jgi:uncharacterized protein YraI
MRHLKSVFIITLLAALTLQACNLPDGIDPNAPDFDLTVTANAALIETALASGELPPTEPDLPLVQEPAPAGNEAPPPTEDLSNPSTSTATPTGSSSSGVVVVVSVATNCRTGPGQAYPSIYGLPVGVTGKVVGKNSSVPNYWVIEVPNSNGGTCWLWGQYATVTGDTNTLKVVAVPATPTPTKTSTPTTTKTNTPTPTATPTNTVQVVTKPNAPVITSSSVVCTDLNDGTYKYEASLTWSDNSNNETSFEFSTTFVPSFSLTAPANTTQLNFTEIFQPGTLAIYLRARNSAGISAEDSTSFTCP